MVCADIVTNGGAEKWEGLKHPPLLDYLARSATASWVRILGSSQSLKASPSRLKARTAVITARAGKITRWGASNRWPRASFSMAPQLGIGARTPKPRKLRVDSARIAPAIAIVAWISTGCRMFGIKWRIRIFACVAPNDLAASTYSISLACRTWALARRA